MISRRQLVQWFGKTTVVWFEHNRLLVLLIIFLIVQYFVAIRAKNYLKEKYKYISSDDPWSTNYMLYYKKAQVFDLVRLVMSLSLLGYVLTTYESWFFSVFAIWIWALVITFQSVILSFGLYFYFLSQYRVGDTVKIGLLTQWEIMYIEPLYMAIAEKNDDADHTGKLYVISNKLVWENTIVRVRLVLRSYSKCVLRVAYSPEYFDMSFEEFVVQLEEFLSTLFNKIPKKAYNHYQSYVWFKYKLDFEPWEVRNNGQTIYVDIWFIELIIDMPKFKRKILAFVDSLRSIPKSYHDE